MSGHLWRMPFPDTSRKPKGVHWALRWICPTVSQSLPVSEPENGDKKRNNLTGHVLATQNADHEPIALTPPESL